MWTFSKWWFITLLHSKMIFFSITQRLPCCAKMCQPLQRKFADATQFELCANQCAGRSRSLQHVWGRSLCKDPSHSIVLMDFNEFSSNFWKVQHSHSRHQRITLKGMLRFINEWSLEGAIYINLWQNSRGGGGNFFSSNFSKYWMVSDETIHKTFRIHKTL